MGRRLPRSARSAPARRRSSRNCRSRASNDSASDDFDSFARCFFRKSRLTLADDSHAARRTQRSARRARRAAKNPGNSSVRRVVRLRSDSSQARVRGATRGPTIARRVARGERTACVRRARRSRDGPICVRSRRRSDHIFGVRRRARQPSGVLARRNDDLALLNRAQMRDCAVLRRAAKSQIRVAQIARERKIFSRDGIFLPKTCCTNSTNSYNYDQVNIGIHSRSTR